ncbi:MAG TPA: MerR family transcriptional regulator [Propionibacteriaceae bacterium]|nr:MerR family transcriptional regulator [Propionibacteriaceae bacterium]
MSVSSAGMRSAQVARAAGVNQQTLRYYERRGLLVEPERSPGGHRLYSPEAVTVLRVIKAAQRLGFTLDEVADLLKTGRHRHGRVDAGLQAHAAAKIAEIDTRMDDLRVIRATLVSAMEVGCDDLMVCATTKDCSLPFTEIARVSAAT